MKLLKYSNVVYSVNKEKHRTPKEKWKLVLGIIVTLLIVGFLFQTMSNFINKQTLKPRVDYGTVNNSRFDFRLSGEGQYTLVFDGDIGNNLEVWNSVIEKLDSKTVSTFVYNRRGYGYSDGGKRQTPEEQAKDLKILLRKSGAVEPFVLVGEQYGSLVLTSFAKQFPDAVSGIVLIDPLKESELGDSSFKKNNFEDRVRRNIEDLGASFGFTTLLRKIGLDVRLDTFEKSLDKESLHEFSVQRTAKKYTQAVKNELTNLDKAESNSQSDGVFKDKPYYLLSNEENNPLISLGSEKTTKAFVSKNKGGVKAITDTQNVVDGINYIIKNLNQKAKEEKKNKNE